MLAQMIGEASWRLIEYEFGPKRPERSWVLEALETLALIDGGIWGLFLLSLAALSDLQRKGGSHSSEDLRPHAGRYGDSDGHKDEDWRGYFRRLNRT